MTFDKFKYHLLALLVTLLWGNTFVFTEVLISAGLSPAEIYLYRTILAYAGLALICHSQWRANNAKDEWLFVGMGLSGGSLFFLAEITAVKYTLSGNVALLESTTQIFIVLLAFWLKLAKQLSWHFFVGAAITLLGVALLVFNGTDKVQINFFGDALALFAGFVWAIYLLLIKRLSGSYSPVFMTRKVFFYGGLTVLPYFLIFPDDLNPHLLAQPMVIGSLSFLGIVASLLCFWAWTIVVKRLGPVMSANYIYLYPVVAVAAAALFLGEPVTWLSVLGAMLILGGVYYSERMSDFSV